MLFYILNMFQVDKRFTGKFKTLTSGMFVNVSPIRKWAGVRARRSFGSLEIEVIGWEFKKASTSVVYVNNSSHVNILSPIVL